MPIFIRRATVDDAPAIAPLLDAYRQFYRRPSAPALAERCLRERLTNGESVVFVAALEGRAGLAGFTQLYPVFSSVSIGRAWILNDLYVDPSSRRHGVGRALLERARQHGVETGAKYLELATEITNLPGQRLYESLGWEREREFYHYELPL